LILWFLILSISLQQLIHVSEEGNPDFQGWWKGASTTM
jgi:hypothetical protein